VTKPTSRCYWMGSLGAAALVLTLAVLGLPEVQAQEKKPNILIIWGDDIGYHNISAYNHGIMGYRTPDIDRIAREGTWRAWRCTITSYAPSAMPLVRIRKACDT
jgi:hypothetical protein